MTPARPACGATPVPAVAGIGLRQCHVAEVLANPPAVGWVEVHSENYLAAGGPRPASLERIRRDYLLSCHGVGLSLGSADGIDAAHLAALAALYRRFQPALVSEHLSWSISDGVYLNDLLPLPYTEEALGLVCRNVDRAQEGLGREILLENPSTYLQYRHSVMPEAQFLAEVARRTGCGILLDVNNIHVSAGNHGFSAEDYLLAIPPAAVGEIHLAGHSIVDLEDGRLLLDDHGAAVADAVWALYETALRVLGPRPTLIEWDRRIPPLGELLGEAAKAARRLRACAPGQGAGGEAHAV